jgi:Family of unknown function (DUF5989)
MSNAAERSRRSHAGAVTSKKSNKTLGRGETIGFLAEFWLYLRERKKFWLLPIVIVMVLFGGLIVLTKGTALAPFVYTLF